MKTTLFQKHDILNTMKTIRALAFLIFSSFSMAAQNYIGDTKEINTILSNITQFSEHIMNSDYDAIAAAYTEDAKIFPENRDIIGGQEPIRKYWELPENVKILHLSLIHI